MNDIMISCFTELACKKNIQDASVGLFLSPQAIWKYIKNLEHELGVNLFHPGTSDLTTAGQHYFLLFETHHRELMNTKARIRLYYDQLTYNFKIGYSEWIDPLSRIGQAVTSFRHAHPKTRISSTMFQTTDLMQGLLSHEIDIAIVPEQHILQDRNLCIEEIDVENLCLFISQAGTKDIDLSCPDTCYGLPYFWSTPWEAGWLEQKAIIKNDMKFSNINPQNIVILKNFQSVCKELEFSSGCTVAGSNYSVCRHIPGIQTRKLPRQVGLNCLFHPANENPLIREFIENSRNILADIREKEVPSFTFE